MKLAFSLQQVLFILIVFSIFQVTTVYSADMGISIQLRLKDPIGNYPTQSGLLVKVQVLSPVVGCILREEIFSSQTITDGNLSVLLGSGTLGSYDPGLSLLAVYDNTTSKTNLTCVDSTNVVTGTGQTYMPAALDGRVLRMSTTIAADNIVADFNMRSTPYAIVAESIGGKQGPDILVRNTGTQMSQSNLEALLADGSRYTNLLNIATSGQAQSATNATTAVDFSGSLFGDVTGSQSATVVTKIRGIEVSSTAPSLGQVLVYDGSQYVPVTPAPVAVTSVNGQTGAVVLSAANISGVITSGTSFLGDVTGNASATVVSTVGGKSSAAIAISVNDVSAATHFAIASAIVKRDGSGNVSVSTISSTNNSTQNIYLYESTNTNSVRFKAPNSFADYILTLPTTDGNNGEVLQTDGSGNLSWVAQGGGGVTSASIVSALGYTPADEVSLINYPLKNNNLSDLTSATVARANLGLGDAATLNVGTSAGTIAAGDDFRLSGALLQTSFDTYVASATCLSGQTMYWSSVTSTFLCQNILVSGDISGIVSNVAVVKLQGVGVSFSSISNNQIMQYNGINFINRNIPTCAADEYITFDGSLWSCAADAGAGGSITSINVTTPISSTGGSTPTLSMSQANGSTDGFLSSSDWTSFNDKVSATSAAVISALGYIPASSTALGGYIAKSNNLSDLTSATIARTNLGLGGAAILNVGSTAGTVMAGDDSRVTSALNTSTVFAGDVSGTYGAVTLNNSGVAPSMYSKVTVNVKGLITSGTTLVAGDIPNLDASKITTGQLPVTLGGTGAITSAAALVNLNAARRGANDDITSFANSIIFSAVGTALIVDNNQSIGGDLTVAGAVDATSKKSAISVAPTTTGTTTAYVMSYGAATDAKITVNTTGDVVKFYVNAVNTGAATLKVGDAPVANLFSRFTGLAVDAGDLQVGTHEATFTGTEWVVDIPPRRFATGAINLTNDVIYTLSAPGVRVGDTVSCSYTQTGTMSNTNNWVFGVNPIADNIRIVAFENGTAGPITSISCVVFK